MRYKEGSTFHKRQDPAEREGPLQFSVRDEPRPAPDHWENKQKHMVISQNIETPFFSPNRIRAPEGDPQKRAPPIFRNPPHPRLFCLTLCGTARAEFLPGGGRQWRCCGSRKRASEGSACYQASLWFLFWGFRVQGLGFVGYGLGFRVKGLRL